ncbi:MAG: ATP-binding protein [Pseudomonadota bacterium]
MNVAVPKRIRLETDLRPGLPPVEGDEGQLQQVLMNLLKNAVEAIPDAGTIRVITGECELTSADVLRCAGAGDLPTGRYGFMSVADDGTGMDDIVRARIFDPFYSTKVPGRGLGLAMVFGIVRAHGGAILLESEPGCGTTFTIYLPLARRQSAVRAPAHQEAQSAWRGTGTVLIADDEPAIVQMIGAVLKRHGLRVLTASDGEAAAETFAAHADRIVAVILDRTMSRMTGDEALARIRAVRSEIPVLISSGYANREWPQEIPGPPPHFLAKPYTIATLIKAVRALLEPGAGG